MINKIINTMFHGSMKAKIFLWSVFVLFVAAVLMGVLAAVLSSTVFLMGAVVAGVAAFITSQSVSLRELERKEKKRKQKDQQSVSGRNTSGGKEELQEGGENARDREKKKARYISSMNERKMKQLLKEHKVRQVHVFVMVDSYPEMHVSQTPAVLWKTNTNLHILLIDSSSREVKIPLADIKGILLEKNIPANPEEDYAPFQYSNFMSRLYKPFLPTCQEVSKDGEMGYVKTLFTIAGGVSFTNTSMAGLMKVLHKVPLLVNDPVNMSPRFDEYFKEVYRYSLLCKNGVFSLDEYRERMERVLQELLSAPIDANQFAKSLRDMSNYRLITSDYVTKYTQIYMTKKQRS